MRHLPAHLERPQHYSTVLFPPCLVISTSSLSCNVAASSILPKASAATSYMSPAQMRLSFKTNAGYNNPCHLQNVCIDAKASSVGVWYVAHTIPCYRTAVDGWRSRYV